jgi:hypothetical protein
MPYQSSVIDVFTGKKKIIFNAGIESTIDYGEQKNVYKPEVSLLFSPFGLPFIPIDIIGTDTNEVIQSLIWSKDRNNPGGLLQVEFTPDKDTLLRIQKSVQDTPVADFFSKIWDSLGMNLEDLLKPMALCQLWIDGYHVMTGNVRSCIRNSSTENDSRTVSYSVTIDELGNLYNMNTLSLDAITLDGMQAQIIDAINTASGLVAGIKGVSIADGIKAIVGAFSLTSFEQKITFSDGFPLYLRLLALANPLGAISNLGYANAMTVDSNMFQLNSTASSQSSLWSFMKSLIPTPWMEFFCESGGRTMVTDGVGVPSVLFPSFNYVVSRSTPYSNPLIGTVSPVHIPLIAPYDLSAISMLIGGDFVIITDDIIQNKSLGFDCINQNTVFHTRYTNKGVVNAPDLADKSIKSVGPLNPFASGGISTFGIREMFQTMDGTSMVGLGSSQSYVERIAKNTVGLPGSVFSKPTLSNILATWFRNQSRFREGSVTTRCIPWARAGMYCLYLPSLTNKKPENVRDIGIYYIDSLNHSYGLSNESMDYTTTLNLIRGVPLPTSLSQAAMLLFDFEIVPPESGLSDGEYKVLKSIRDAAAFGIGIV